jgi:DNA-binding response OmpR family regulator
MKILVVEDDPELLEPVNTALSRAGYIVDGVGTCELATSLIAEKDYDLRAVISKYNGVEKKLKQLLEAQNKLT